jgi:hypothetical protein
MHFFSWFLLLCLSWSLGLLGEKIDTFYGPLDVQEAVLIDLIHSPAMQRLKRIHQYGVSFYTTHRENYTRYEHSLGVFSVLRLKGASLEEQIAGLLHDVSHTAFSHVGDWVFGREFQDQDYQTSTHKRYLINSGLAEILAKYGYTADQVSVGERDFMMFDSPLPDLCADRIDYNIQGAFYQNMLTHEECQTLVRDLTFHDGRWILTNKALAAKLARFSLFMTENCWGSPCNYVTSRWLADAILRGMKIGLITWEDLHFGVDQDIWDALCSSEDPVIKTKMSMLADPKEYYHLVPLEEATILARFRCRGIDPWIQNDSKIVRLSSIDSELATRLLKLQERAVEGWPIVMETSAIASPAYR